MKRYRFRENGGLEMVDGGMWLHWSDHEDAVAEAVANEGKRIATWLENQLVTGVRAATELQNLIDRIRNGKHETGKASMSILEWSEERAPNDDCPYNHCVAITPFGVFRIEWKGWKAYPDCDYMSPWGYVTVQGTLDEAKAAALEDYTRRGEAFAADERKLMPTGPWVEGDTPSEDGLYLLDLDGTTPELDEWSNIGWCVGEEEAGAWHTYAGWVILRHAKINTRKGEGEDE